MTQLALELSELEIEPIELQEVGTTSPQQGQNRNLETLTTPEGKNDVLAILTLTVPLPVNNCSGCGSCSTCNTCLACIISCAACTPTCIVTNCNSCFTCGSCK